VEYKKKIKNMPEAFLLVQTLKEEADLVSWQLKSKEHGEPGQKRRKPCKTRRNN
jgi:hypothetical protein